MVDCYFKSVIWAVSTSSFLTAEMSGQFLALRKTLKIGLGPGTYSRPGGSRGHKEFNRCNFSNLILTGSLSSSECAS